MFTAPLPQRLMDDEGPVWAGSFVDPWTVLSLKLSFGSLSVSLYTRLCTEFINHILYTQHEVRSGCCTHESELH